MTSNKIPSERATARSRRCNAADGVNGMKLKDTPFVYVKYIGAMILDHLDRHDQ